MFLVGYLLVPRLRFPANLLDGGHGRCKPNYWRVAQPDRALVVIELFAGCGSLAIGHVRFWVQVPARFPTATENLSVEVLLA